MAVEVVQKCNFWKCEKTATHAVEALDAPNPLPVVYDQPHAQKTAAALINAGYEVRVSKLKTK